MSECWPIRPKPDPDSAVFWRGLAENKILLRRCDSCGAIWLYPKSICPACGSSDVTWELASGDGELWSFTEVHKGLGTAFQAMAPYTIAITTLAEGPTLMGFWQSLVAPQIGQPVRVAPFQADEDTYLIGVHDAS